MLNTPLLLRGCRARTLIRTLRTPHRTVRQRRRRSRGRRRRPHHGGERGAGPRDGPHPRKTHGGTRAAPLTGTTAGPHPGTAFPGPAAATCSADETTLTTGVLT